MIQVGDPNTRNDNRRDDGQGGPTLENVLTPKEVALLKQLNQSLEGRGFLPVGGQPRLKGEFSQSASHKRGMVSMARTNDPNSAGSQFFICVADVPQLDRQYSIFGQVVSGMAVADSVAAAPRDASDNPHQPIRIRSAEVIEGAAALGADERAAWQGMGEGE
jgi:cyclophilin family peptidyl-prolyl cis-trans isomerase